MSKSAGREKETFERMKERALERASLEKMNKRAEKERIDFDEAANLANKKEEQIEVNEPPKIETKINKVNPVVSKKKYSSRYDPVDEWDDNERENKIILYFSAKVLDENDKETIINCVSEKIKKFDDSPIWYVGYASPIAKAVLKAHEEGKSDFKCGEDKYHLLELRQYQSPESLELIDFTVFDTTPQTIYLYKYDDRKCLPCFKRFGYDSIENVNVIINTLEKTPAPVRVDAQRCRRCEKILIGEESLKNYEEHYGVLLFNRIFQQEPDSSRDSYTYRPDTVLSRFGYVAGGRGLNRASRERIIAFLIDSGISSKREIKGILERFINQRGSRNQYALPHWESDLRFTSEYNVGSQVTYTNCHLIRAKRASRG